MLSTYTRQPIQEVLVNIALSQEVSETIEVNTKVLGLPLGFLGLHVGLDHLDVTGHSAVVAQVLPQFLNAWILLSCRTPFEVFLESDDVECIN